MRFIADTRAAVDHTMRIDDDAFSQRDFIADHSVWPNAATLADERPRADYGRGMDLIGSVLN